MAKLISLQHIVNWTRQNRRGKKQKTIDNCELLSCLDETTRSRNSLTESENSLEQCWSLPSTNEGLSHLFLLQPDEIQLKILSFIYDEIGIIEKVLGNGCNFPYRDFFARSILVQHNKDETFCKICSEPLCYPYQLVDSGCGHKVCGICAFLCREELGSCPCGIKLRSRPKRLRNHQSIAEGRAYWLLNETEYYKWYKRNELRLFAGLSGYFGRRGTPNTLDPMCRVGFEADFDYLKVLDISTSEQQQDLKKLLPKKCGQLVILLCPAHENYRPFYIEEIDSKDFNLSVFANREWLLHISNDDIITLEEEDVVPRKKAKCKRFEIRLTGWEQNVGSAADYAF